jgi:restriction system protein
MHMSDATIAVADHFKLSAADRAELLPSGKFSKIASRVGWSRTFLNKAGLIQSEQRGVWSISPTGREALKRFPQTITVSDLRTYPSFVEWANYCDQRRQERSHNEQQAADDGASISHDPTPDPPKEVMGRIEFEERARVKLELVAKLQAMHWRRFETLVEDVLIKLEYGTSAADVRRELQARRSGDQGVDAVISQDRLGLDRIYIQAKRYRDGAKVGVGEVRDFVGAMHNVVRRGVFITTARFTDEAREYAQTRGESSVRLIDGETLADLMIEIGLGVETEETYKLYSVDDGFFDAES